MGRWVADAGGAAQEGKVCFFDDDAAAAAAAAAAATMCAEQVAGRVREVEAKAKLR